MRRIALLGLAAALGLGGCPDATVIPTITILDAGTYTGTLVCAGTRTAAGASEPLNDLLDTDVVVTGAGDLAIDGSDYVEGRTTQAIAGDVTLTQTVQGIRESGDTVSIQTTGTIDGQGKVFQTSHQITIRRIDDRHVEMTDAESSRDAAAGISLEQTCTGTLAR